MKEFNLTGQSLLPGQTLIEASAGTGKTYNIQHLYLRFVTERGLTPDTILVVTFSREATAELKLRITRNLVRAEDELLAIASGGKDISDISDADLRCILERALRNEDLDEVLRRVQFAVRAMDESAIQTIHGFCLSVLTDYAFESGSPFGVELTEDRSRLFADILSDFVQSRIANCKDLIGRILRRYMRLEVLAKIPEMVYGKDDVLPLGEAELPDVSSLYSSLLFEDLDEIRKALGAKRGKKAWRLIDFLLEHAEADDETLLEFLSLVNSDYVRGMLGTGYYQNVLPPQFQGVISRLREVPEVAALRVSLDFVEYIREYYRSAVSASAQKELAYDDLLYRTREALRESNGRLVRRVREAFGAVLVDEFQDTSAVQYEIFNTLFGGDSLPFFMIGDPKQSIYAFRGADIFSYMQAVTSEGVNRVTLRRNFRSAPEYISAMNLLFANRRSRDDKALPFIFDAIDYIEIAAGRTDNRRLVSPEEWAPLEIRWKEDEEALDAEVAERQIIESVADDIVCRLESAQEGELYYAEDGDKSPLRPSDFAVLVEKNIQGERIRSALNRRGVVGVLLKTDSVFAAVEAEELLHILRAVRSGGRERELMAVLATRCFSYSASELAEFRDCGARTLDYWSEFFHELQQVMLQSGFLQCFTLFFEREHPVVEHAAVKAVLAVAANGERAITNYLQLVEILEEELLLRGESDTSVAEILEELILDANGSDEYEMRLESDEDAVKIMTVHKSKGLEFPVVYVPFMYSGVHAHSRLIRPVLCHLDTGGSGLILSDSELRVKSSQLQLEERAERMRLFYVALTRAVDKCIVYGGSIKNIERSVLADIFDPDFSRIGELVSSGYIGLLPHWENRGRIYSPAGVAARLECREFGGRIERDWGVMSYSSLVSHEFATADVRSDIPLYTEAEDIITGVMRDNLQPLPSGNLSGSAVHEILEQVDLASPAKVFDDVIGESLKKYGIIRGKAVSGGASAKIEAVRMMLEQLASLPLSDNAGKVFTLSDVPKAEHIPEMSFYFPVRERIDTLRLQEFFSRRGLAVYRQQEELQEVLAGIGLQLQSRGFREGFLYGLIDLTFSYDGRYYFADWKTNNLARYGGYQPAAVLTSMGESGYLLQFYIYTVALNLLLKQRIPDFEYSRHFGGGYYLYLRGIDSGHPEQGVFYDAPAEADVAELVEIFTGRSF